MKNKTSAELKQHGQLYNKGEYPLFSFPVLCGYFREAKV